MSTAAPLSPPRDDLNRQHPTSTTHSTRSKGPGFVQQLLTLAARDLALEWKSRTRVNATVFFSVLTLLLFSFAAGPSHATLAQNAPGYLWLSILLSSVLALSESMRLELENDALEGLRLVPVSPRALFLAKALVNSLYLTALGFLLVPIAVALYGAPLTLGFAPLAGALVLGALGISAPGTLYGAIAAQARAKDVMLPLLLFPILVPSLLASVKATALAMHGDPMGEYGAWIGLLAAFDVLYWALCALLFGRVIEES